MYAFRANLAVALVSAMWLAGCTGGIPGAGGPSGPGDVDADGVGTVVGTVTDDALAPLGDVDVTIENVANATTDDAGAFVLDSLPAGDYEIRFSKLGYELATREVAVQGDQRVEVTVSLQPIPGAVPYTDAFTQEGFLGCGVASRAPVGGQPSVAACAPFYLAGLEQFEQYALDWPLPPLHQSSGFIGESQWEPNQASAAAMRLEWTHWVPGAVTAHFDQQSGRSPLWVRIPIDNMTQALEENGSPETCTMDECFINSLHWTHAGTLGESYPVDATIMFQQRYTDYLTVFFNQPLPHDYSALPDE